MGSTVATLKDAERARSDSAEQLRELGAHAISVEEEESADEPNETEVSDSTSARPKKSQYVVVAYFEEDPPPTMPESLQVQAGRKTRDVPLKAKRSERFQIEPAIDDVGSRLE
jgi:hypothetical protein